MSARFLTGLAAAASAEFWGSLPSVSDMPQIYVHMGLPKTATTTLQTQVLMGHSAWVYLGTRLPRVLNADADFKRLEAYVQRGEGRAEEVTAALLARHQREGKPLMVSEENFSIGAFEGYPAGHPLTHTRSAKLDRLCEVLQPMDAVVMVSLRPFRKAVFSAFVEYQEQWAQSGASPAELVQHSDVMGMYRYAQLRQELESRWPGRVHALDFADIVRGEVRWLGFSWQAAAPLPNTRQHPRAEGGVKREVVRKRPLLPLAKALAPWAPGVAHSLWSVRARHEVFVPFWTDDMWQSLKALEEESDAAREAWLGLSDPN